MVTQETADSGGISAPEAPSVTPAHESKPAGIERLTLGETLRELGFLPALFSMIFGTPALISLAQAAFITGDLSAPFQEIIATYQYGMATFGTLVEPYLTPIVHWLGDLLNSELTLFPHWRHLFLLATVFWLARARSRIGSDEGVTFKFLLGMVVLVALSVVGTLAAGLVPLDGGWKAQGLIAAISTSISTASILLGGIAFVVAALV